MVDHVLKFEHNVQARIQDIKRERKALYNKLAGNDLTASSLFFGIALGVVASRVACLCRSA